MQQEGARLKLLSVLKVAEKKPLTNEALKVDVRILYLLETNTVCRKSPRHPNLQAQLFS